MKKILCFYLLILLWSVHSFAQVQATFTISDDQGCPPLTVTFNNTTPGGLSNSYQWDFGDGDTSSEYSPTHTFQVAGNFMVTLNGFSLNGWPLITGLDSVNVSGATIMVSPEICLVTVDSSSTKNIIVWEKPADAAISAVNIYREELSNWILAGTVPQSDLSIFIDSSLNVNPETESYSYRISFVDTCGNESGLSTFHQTMHLVAYTVPPENHINLVWVYYSGFNFTNYQIFRDTTGQDNFELLDSVAAGLVNYTDSSPPENSKYVVVIQHPEGCTATKVSQNHNSSRSNRTNSAPPSGSGENAREYFFLIAPNPNGGKFNLIGDKELIGSPVKIYNILGSVVYEGNFEKNLSIDLHGNGKGIYFVRVEGKTKTINQKLMLD